MQTPDTPDHDSHRGGFGIVVLEWFVAPRLSELTFCSAPEIAPLANPIRRLMLEGVFGNLPVVSEAQRTAVVQVCRRSSEAICAYIAGRKCLIDFANSPVKSHNLQTHAEAVQYFEACISSVYLALNMWIRHFHALGFSIAEFAAVEKGKIIYKPNEIFDRLRMVHNRVKHFDEDVEEAMSSGDTPPASPIWFVNTGIEAINKKTGAVVILRFDELVSVLEEARDITLMFSERLPERIRAYIRQDNHPAGSQQPTPSD